MEYTLREYTSRNPLNAIIAENMVDVTHLHNGIESFEEKACFCFSRAYAICMKMVKDSPAPIWCLPDYYRLAKYHSDEDENTVVKAVILSIVLILTRHFGHHWKEKNKKLLDKIEDHIHHLHITGETIKLPGGTEMLTPLTGPSVCSHILNVLRRGTDIDCTLPYAEFSPQKTDDIEGDSRGVVQNIQLGLKQAQDEIAELDRNKLDGITREEFDRIFPLDNNQTFQKETEEKEKPFEASETIDSFRQKIRIELLNFLFKELKYDTTWIENNRKRMAMARVYAAILGHKNPNGIKDEVGRVKYVDRPKGLDKEIADINKLLADINIEWKIKL